MSKINSGRYTAMTDEDFVVFLIGMRVNRLLAIRKWWPVFQAMPRMLIDLMRNPQKGYLGGRTLIGWRSVTMIQYWRSVDDLERFARNPDDPHWPAWKKFYQLVGSDGSVGIWHETYPVHGAQSENVYVNVPRLGLGEVVDLIPATGRRASARGHPSKTVPISSKIEEVNP